MTATKNQRSNLKQRYSIDPFLHQDWHLKPSIKHLMMTGKGINSSIKGVVPLLKKFYRLHPEYAPKDKSTNKLNHIARSLVGASVYWKRFKPSFPIKDYYVYLAFNSIDVFSILMGKKYKRDSMYKDFESLGLVKLLDERANDYIQEHPEEFALILRHYDKELGNELKRLKKKFKPKEKD